MHHIRIDLLKEPPIIEANIPSMPPPKVILENLILAEHPGISRNSRVDIADQT